MSSPTNYGAAGSDHTQHLQGNTNEQRQNHARSEIATHPSEADEETALLPGNSHGNGNSGTKPPARRATSLRPYMTQRLVRDYADLLLLLCYLITGLLDSTATVIWGAFVSMQTGNSIYVGLGLTDPTGSNRWIKSALSIGCFSTGSFLFSRLHRVRGGSMRRRWVILLSFGLQTGMILTAALIIHFTPRPEPGDQHDLHWHVLVPLALIAGQSAGQTVCSRALEYGSLTSTVLTSIYCDLWADQKLFSAPSANVERNRRGAAPILLVLGAIVGGLWSRTEHGLEGALWTAAGLKGAILVIWLYWKGEKEEQDG